MARIRTIKPEIWQDEDLAEVSEAAMLLAIGLLNHADDEGFFKANPALVKAAVFPLREPSVSIQCGLTELSIAGFISLYEGSDGKQYGHIRTFAAHQRVNRPTPSKIKELVDLTEPSLNPHGGLTAGKEGKGKERKGTGKGGSLRSLAPSCADAHSPPADDPPGHPEPSTGCALRMARGGDLIEGSAETLPARPEDTVATIPCVGTGPDEYHVSPEKIAEWATAFPGVDVITEVRQAAQWCRDNPTRRKTHSGVTRFVNSWLARAQNRGGSPQAAAAGPVLPWSTQCNVQAVRTFMAASPEESHPWG